jgi:cytochrome P450
MAAITEYDPFAREVKEDPYPYYAWLRSKAPVYHNKRLDIWALSRYSDVSAALRNHEVFSSAEGFGRERVRVPMMISTDPPQHGRLRSLASKAFTPRIVARMEPHIRKLLHGLLNEAIHRGSLDLVTDVAEPLPVIVIAEMMGVDPEQREKFKKWSDDTIAVVGGSPEADLNRYSQTWQEFKSYFTDLFEQRRREPRDDFLTALVRAQDERGALNLVEMLNFNLLLLVAGNETTTNLIANGALALLEHPDEALKLRERPDRIPSAVEECLRYDAPIQSSFRTTTREIEIHGVKIPAASKVMMIYAASNRDPDQFENPDSFDVCRSSNEHLSFGDGIHYCLGAPLARLEAKIALEEIPARFRRIRLDPAGARLRVDNPLFRGLKKLPLLFDPL